MSDRVEKKTALLIGIDQYDSTWIGDLRGCIEDIRLAEAYIKKLVGIPESNIVKLLSPSTANLQDPSTKSLPTLNNVVSAFQKLASDAQENDIIYIHYAGHGTRRPTCFPNLKTDNQDESIVLVRHNDPERRIDYLRDVEIAFLLKEIADKGALVTIVLDCCHSGGAVRAGDVSHRGVDNIPLKASPKREPIRPLSILEESWTRKTTGALRGASVTDHWMTSTRGIEFLAACRADQKALEIRNDDGIVRGLLTGCLNDVLNMNKLPLGQLSCGMVYNLVSRRVTEHKANLHAQDVVFGGQHSRSFFGVDSVSQEAATVVTGVSPLGSGQVQVSLDVGKAHDVVKGDSFAVYPADKVFTNITDYNSSLAIVTVTNVDDFVSAGRIDGSAESVQSGCKAMKLRDILKLFVLSPRTAVVVADGPEVSEQKVQEVKDKIKADGKLIKLTESNTPFFKIRVKSSGDFQVSFRHKDQTAIVTIQSTDILLPYLTHLAIYYNLFNLGRPGYTSGISVKIIGTLPKGIEPPSPQVYGSDSPPLQELGLRELVSGDPLDIPHDDSIGIQVRNTTFKSMYLEVLDLEPSWKVSRIYPWKENASIKLESGQSVNFFITMSMPANVTGSIQLERFDAIVILATTSNQCNFPDMVLPVLNETLGWRTPPLGEPKNGRGGKGVDSGNWFMQRLDVRVVK
ncbi:hypothetical protein CC78DRAFT_534137 [Lojkania enalia]|uniref:Peptidase C14 caspase domain-containing protein n=1 Tax=Lojkania enalia TaxID=147567 RepID=A0A9P4K710_9PLEO|nr:hypothetical protein CC78DRAFT_534137 [Didymosphaeria enalia]